MEKKKKFNLSGPIALLLALLVLAIFIPLNLIFSYSDKVIDMTPSGKYTLNPKTIEVLDQVSDKKIDIYFLAQLNELKETPRFLPLYHTLTKLEERDNITLTCFDPNENPDLVSKLNPPDELNPTGRYSVGSGDIFVRCEETDTTKWINFKKCFQTDSAGILEYAGEELIAGALYVCTTGNLPTVYFLSGYSDKTVEKDYAGYASAIRNDNYNVGTLDLSAEKKIPEDTAIIYLAAPQKDISDADKEILSDYLDNGGSMSMFLPPCETEGRFKNIEYLLAKFELGMDYNILSETQSDYILYDRDGEKNDKYFRVSFPLPDEDSTEDLTTDINTLVSTDMTSYMPGISHARSISYMASGSALIEKGSIIENLPIDMNNMDKFTIKSEPMGGDSDTKEAAKKLTASPLCMGFYSYNKQTGGKIIVIGSDDIIDDNNFSMHTAGSRILALFSNTWLFDSDVDMGIGNKENSYDTMKFDSAEQATSTIRIFMIIPVVLAVAGVAVWLKRRNS